MDWYKRISKEKMSIILNLKYFYPFVFLDPNLITLGWILKLQNITK